MLEPAFADDHVRQLALSVKLLASFGPTASREEIGTLPVIPSAQASFNFPTTATNYSNVRTHQRTLRCLK